MTGIKPKGWIADAAARVQADQDAELFASGRRSVAKSRCKSLIVATDPRGDRNYHNCGGDVGHEVDTWHGCGCGETWEDKTRAVSGPLSEVAFSS